MYLDYPYKWKDLTSNTVQLPYFPNSEVTEHEFSLAYNEWMKVVKVLLEEYIETLISGEPLILPHGLGRLTLFKYKRKGSAIDWGHFRKTGEKIYHNNIHTDGYAPILIWNYRVQTKAKFKFKRHWSCRFVDTIWKNISKRIMEDYTIIYNLSEQ